MKFILNTAVDPHFCALFSEKGERVAYHEWTDRRRDGAELWDFLNERNVEDFTFIGGVSGPGGFSSLRAGAGVLNSLAFALNLPVHAVRADRWMKGLLDKQFVGDNVVVVLNSFGDGVWIQDGEELARLQVEEAGQRIANNLVCVSWLSDEKKKAFVKGVEIVMDKSAEVLLSVLGEVMPNRQFATDYEVPPVG